QIFGKLRMHLEEYLLSKCSLATTGIRPNAFNFPATPTFILEPYYSTGLPANGQAFFVRLSYVWKGQ
ncbi:MAG: hypothetical protein WAP58_06110, partial [Peptococcia bacterium]